jgi:hypothetical protein
LLSSPYFKTKQDGRVVAIPMRQSGLFILPMPLSSFKVAGVEVAPLAQRITTWQ